MPRIRTNALAVFFAVIFLAALAGQAVAGHNQFNDDAITHAKLTHQQPETYTMGRYLVSSEFGQTVMENWQSEYLQFFLYLFTTIYLVQRGSSESKKPGDEGRGTEEEQKLGRHADPDSPGPAKRSAGFVRFLYSNSLALTMLAIWLGTWFAQSVTGWSMYNNSQKDHMEAAVSWAGYLGSSDFWETTLQNWQSEFLAIGSFSILGVYLRQRGSPESKPVGAPHSETGSSTS